MNNKEPCAICKQEIKESLKKTKIKIDYFEIQKQRFFNRSAKIHNNKDDRIVYYLNLLNRDGSETKRTAMSTKLPGGYLSLDFPIPGGDDSMRSLFDTGPADDGIIPVCKGEDNLHKMLRYLNSKSAAEVWHYCEVLTKQLKNGKWIITKPNPRDIIESDIYKLFSEIVGYHVKRGISPEVNSKEDLDKVINYLKDAKILSW